MPGKGAERRFWGNSSVLSLHVCICQNSSNDTLKSAAFQKRILTKIFFQIKDVCCDSLVTVIFLKLKFFVLNILFCIRISD